MTREEAIKEAYGIPVTKAQHEALQFLIPELAESEDERVRKSLVALIKEIKLQPLKRLEDWDSMLAYLEKQREQKPNISDEAIRDGIIHFGITQYQIDNWLKKHINVIEQKPAEWSDRDKHILNSVINLVHATTDGAWGTCIGDEIENWLKSLRPQPHWKPSEEQMNTLIRAQSQCCPTFADILQSLHDDLTEKLM